MENWKKCRFEFQTCLHSNQDYSGTIKDISLEKIRLLENSILHNRPVPKFAPLPQGATKNREKMCKTYARHCSVPVSVSQLVAVDSLDPRGFMIGEHSVANW